MYFLLLVIPVVALLWLYFNAPLTKTVPFYKETELPDMLPPLLITVSGNTVYGRYMKNGNRHRVIFPLPFPVELQASALGSNALPIVRLARVTTMTLQDKVTFLAVHSNEKEFIRMIEANSRQLRPEINV